VAVDLLVNGRSVAQITIYKRVNFGCQSSGMTRRDATCPVGDVAGIDFTGQACGVTEAQALLATEPCSVLASGAKGSAVARVGVGKS
jgi:hypothetical protein